MLTFAVLEECWLESRGSFRCVGQPFSFIQAESYPSTCMITSISTATERLRIDLPRCFRQDSPCVAILGGPSFINAGLDVRLDQSTQYWQQPHLLVYIGPNPLVLIKRRKVHMDPPKSIALLSPPESDASSPTSSPSRSIDSSEGSLWGWPPPEQEPLCVVSDATEAEATTTIISQRSCYWRPSKPQESLSLVPPGSETSLNVNVRSFEHNKARKSRHVTNQTRSSEVVSDIKRERKATSESLQSNALKRLLQENHPWWDILSVPSSQQPNPNSSDRQITAYTSITGFDPTGRMQKLLDDLTNFYVSDNSFYQSGQAGSISAASQQALTKLFDKYRGQHQLASHPCQC